MKKLYSLLILVFTVVVGNAQIVTIPDANFKAKLIDLGVDSNNDGNIQTLEAEAISNLNLFNSNISDLTGISSFINLQTLNCIQNQLITLEISNMYSLQSLSCGSNSIVSLNLTGLPSLTFFSCTDNTSLTSLTINSMLNLQTVNAYNCSLTSVSIINVPNLNDVYLYNNQLSSININSPSLIILSLNNNNFTNFTSTNLPNLKTLHITNNPLVSFDIINKAIFNNFACDNTYLTALDFYEFPQLGSLRCENISSLTSINIKNGRNETTFQFSNCPNLEYICADNGQITSITNRIALYGYTNCHVNAYCSFVPGGTFYTIQGNNRFDSNNNGCDADDINYPNLRLSFTSGSIFSALIPDTSGAYHYDVQAGTQTFTPVLENPTYFTVSPISANVTFPTSASPFTQNFCVSANGTHNDLEITLFPIGPARPGADAKYKIIYKNKGTTTQSGVVSLDYYDPIEDLVISSPNFDSQSTNTLNWNFSNLLPFERREILVIFNLNSPTDTPPVNAGNGIGYTATITGATDETPNDNTSFLDQTVVNSLDPNDKTCIEGAWLPYYEVGKYLHYIIRFENSGTANAENIVVKDIIDTSKLDIGTLIPLSGSHRFETKISSTNKVEFIFQNINLPFDDANNDGYIAFKIKSLPAVVSGDLIINSANIYFDYNAPITTNTNTINIYNPLSTPDFEFSSVYTLAPIPAKNYLTLTTKQKVVITSVNIYNTLGQLVQVITNPTETFDISNLKTGSYFIKIISDKGIVSSKFIKE
ncbi:DUF7619 domain-containing protein [Flavobacterium sangjuense]|uniref:Uncharacterized protein n=1 Tax=Flavobacterium sangjuense TaxID=2518177 RepID=A0A4V1CBR5_9FLAO|nr:T9SS type A sorting domain-containing protein [Flavobacterium sangjuense]QBZ96904.1 hypothetical protein GS03_00387 [Flavobacterium sangjuense]